MLASKALVLCFTSGIDFGREDAAATVMLVADGGLWTEERLHADQMAPVPVCRRHRNAESSIRRRCYCMRTGLGACPDTESVQHVHHSAIPQGLPFHAFGWLGFACPPYQSPGCSLESVSPDRFCLDLCLVGFTARAGREARSRRFSSCAEMPFWSGWFQDPTLNKTVQSHVLSIMLGRRLRAQSTAPSLSV